MSLIRTESLQTSFRAWIHLCRLHSPFPLLFFFFPCIWGNLLVHKGTFYWWEACFFLMGCIWARSTGCVINDYLDRNIDGHVTRTKTRPLACGKLSPHQVRNKFFFFVITGLFFLVMIPSSLYLLSIISAFSTMIYPLCKRFFPVPQLFLGFTINCGALMSYGYGHPMWWTQWDIWMLYSIAVLWTMEYDTLYAYQDFQEDRMLGLHSLTLLLGENPKLMKFFFRGCLLFRSGLMFFLYGKVTPLILILLFWIMKRWSLFSHLPFAHSKNYLNAFRISIWEGCLLSILLIYR